MYVIELSWNKYIQLKQKICTHVVMMCTSVHSSIEFVASSTPHSPTYFDITCCVYSKYKLTYRCVHIILCIIEYVMSCNINVLSCMR